MLNYSENYRSLFLELTNRSELFIAMETIVAIIVTVIALGGNVLVCTAVYRNRNLHTRQNVYIVNLAVSDIVVAVFVMPLCTGVLITGRWSYGKTLCRMEGFIAMIANINALETMTLIAVHRYFKVVHSRLYNKIYKKNSVVMSVALSWIFAIALQTNYALQLDYVFHPGKLICWHLMQHKGFSANFIITAFIVQIPFVVIIFCYCKVHRKVNVHISNSFSNNQTVNKFKSVSEIKVNRLLLAIVLSFVFCWAIPVNAIDLSAPFLGQFALPGIVYLVYTFSMALASCINPVLYNALSREFRAEFKRIVACAQVRRSRRVSQVNQAKASAISPAHLGCTEKVPGLDLCTLQLRTANSRIVSTVPLPV